MGAINNMWSVGMLSGNASNTSISISRQMEDLSANLAELRELVEYLCAVDPKLSEALTAWNAAKKME